MILKTDGLILRTLPYSRTSLLADCLILGVGRTWLLAKGAQRPRSPFLGQLDCFYTCEVLFYRRASRVLILKECAALKTRDALRTDWRAAACASYFCDFTSHITPPGVPHDDLFELLETAIDTLAQRGASPGLLYWFELTALKRLGLGLAVGRCPLCGRDPAADGLNRLRVSARQGGVLCRQCEHRDSNSASVMTAGTLALLRAWDSSQTASRAAVAVPSVPQQAEVQSVLADFIAYHLDFQLRSRALALDLIRKPA
ncbi:MAG: DNA repair protein RecO [Kiritimatiellia bacterium]